VSRAERERAARRGVIPVRSSSFVSMLARSDVLAAVGLPIADYFIWNDDFEFSTRMLRHHRGVFVPASVVVHKTATFGATNIDPGDRFYFEVRNKVWLLAHSRGLSVGEKALYGASTVRRWLSTFVASGDRRRLWKALVAGLKAGLSTRPAPNSDVLGDLGEASAAVAQLESGNACGRSA